MASEHGLILVDTKYEFGKGSDGTILLIDEVSYHSTFITFFFNALSAYMDICKIQHPLFYLSFFLEVHTPDSSRYWISHSYEEHFKNGVEPENVDKVSYVPFFSSYYFE